MTDQVFFQLVNEMAQEWNKAEKAIKHAENVDGEVVNPAIFELRYAGRRFVEAHAKRISEMDMALSLLRDAKFDCHRARHDAIDAATSKMTGDLSAAVEFLSAKIVTQNFSEFTEFYGDLLSVRERIAESRENRENRDAIYESIQSVDLDRLVTLYNRFRACEPLLIETANAESRAERRSKLFGYGGLAIAAFSIIISVALYLIG